MNNRNQQTSNMEIIGDRGWGIGNGKSKWTLIQDPPDSQHFIRVLKSNTNVRMLQNGKLQTR